MRIVLVFFLCSLLYSCNIFNKTGSFRESIATKKRNRTFQIHNTKKVINGDTSNLWELRFPEVRAANDASRMMFLEFGSWHKKYEGKYQAAYMAWCKITRR